MDKCERENGSVYMRIVHYNDYKFAKSEKKMYLSPLFFHNGDIYATKNRLYLTLCSGNIQP